MNSRDNLSPLSGIRIAGVTRACAFSPNNVGNDAAIFHAVAERLRGYGAEVTIYGEDRFVSADIIEPVIVNMCREQESISRLKHLEDSGKLVINSGYGIENCTRERMTRLLTSHGIAHPESIIVSTDDDGIAHAEATGFGACWIKRGDFHATHKEDVSYCRDITDVRQVLGSFSKRGIKRAVINRHLEGDLVKFYGVAGEPFFHWFYPLDNGHSKYGHENINGKSRGFGFDIERLKALCAEAADILEVKIYGGDCIVASDGSVRIIDFNDWPSFSPCREDGAEAIAGCVLKSIQSHKK